MIFSYARQKITRFRTFFKKFQSRLLEPDDIEDSLLVTRNIEECRDYLIFPPRISAPGCYETKRRLERDLHFYISNDEDQMRYHYFTVKSYFKHFCEDIFERSYYRNIEKNSGRYSAYLKFYFSQEEINRRYKMLPDHNHFDVDDIPF